jgi:DNA polymerase-3 subunit epsilon
MKRIYCDSFLQVPQNTIGVYFLRNKEGKILYIGKSKNIRKRIEYHLHPANNSAKVEYILEKLKSEHYHDFFYISYSSIFQAEKKEEMFIKRMNPIFNVQYSKHSPELMELMSKADNIFFNQNCQHIEKLRFLL